MAKQARSFRETAVAFILLAGGNIAGQIIGFGALAYVAHRSGPTAVGGYSVDFALCSFAGLAGNFGITYLGSRDIAQDAERRWVVLAQVVCLQVAPLAAVYLIMVLLVGPGLSHQEAVLMPVVATVIFFSNLTPDWFLITLRKAKSVASARLVGQVGYAAVLFAIGGGGFALIRVYAVANAAGLLLTAVPLIWLSRQVCRKAPRLQDGDLSLNRLLGRMKKSLPFGYSLLMLQVYGGIAIPLLGLIAGQRTAGLYGVAYRLPAALITMANVWLSVFFPHGAERAQGDRDTYRREVGRIVSASVVLALLIAVSSAVVASSLIPLMFGEAFASVATPFALLALAAGLILVQATTANVLLATGDESAYGWIVTGIAIGLIIIDIPLISAFGATGAAVGAVIAEVGMIGSTGVLASRSLGGLDLNYAMLTRGLACVAVVGGAGVAARAANALGIELIAMAMALVASVGGTRLWKHV